MTAEGNVNDEHFVLKIPFKYLCGAKWAINIEASWPGHSGSCVQSIRKIGADGVTQLQELQTF